MPVASSKGFTIERKASSSAPPSTPSIETLPSSCWPPVAASAATAASSGSPAWDAGDALDAAVVDDAGAEAAVRPAVDAGAATPEGGGEAAPAHADTSSKTTATLAMLLFISVLDLLVLCWIGIGAAARGRRPRVGC